MKRAEEGSLEFLPQNDATRLRAGRRRDIDDNKNERVNRWPWSRRSSDVFGEADDDGEDGIDGGDRGSL